MTSHEPDTHAPEMDEPTPYDLGLTGDPDLTWDDIEAEKRAQAKPIRAAAAQMEAEYPELTIWM
jgi:hypothetical protein